MTTSMKPAMTSPSKSSPRIAITILAASLSLAAWGCKKDKAGPSTQETTPSSKASDPGKAEGSGTMGAPEVAIGATRTATFPASAKKVAETDEYMVSLAVPETASAGKESSARVFLTPKKGWKLNDDYPYALVVNPPAGVTVAKKTQEKADAVKWEKKQVAEWAIKFTAAEAGTKAFAGDFDFAVCTDATCNPYQTKLAFNVEVK